MNVLLLWITVNTHKYEFVCVDRIRRNSTFCGSLSTRTNTTIC